MSNLSYLLCERHGVMLIKYSSSLKSFTPAEWKSISQYVILSSGMWTKQLVPYKVTLSNNRFCHVFAHNFRGHTLYSCIIENTSQNICNNNLMMFAYNFFYKFLNENSESITSFLNQVATIKELNSKEGTFSDSIGDDEDEAWDQLLIDYDIKDSIMTFEENILANNLDNISGTMKILFGPLDEYLRRASSMQPPHNPFSFKSDIDILHSITIAIFDVSYYKDDSYTSIDTSEQGVITCMGTWNDTWLKTILTDDWYYQPQWQSTILSHAMGIVDDQINNGMLLSRIKSGMVMVLFTVASIDPQHQHVISNNDYLKTSFQQSVKKVKDWLHG